MKAAWAMFAVSTLTFFRDRREHFRRIGFVKLVDNDAVRDRLLPRQKDGGIDCSHLGPTLIAFQRDLVAVLFRHDGTVALDASFAVEHYGEVKGFGGHGLMVAPLSILERPPRRSSAFQAVSRGCAI